MCSSKQAWRWGAIPIALFSFKLATFARSAISAVGTLCASQTQLRRGLNSLQNWRMRDATWIHRAVIGSTKATSTFDEQRGHHSQLNSSVDIFRRNSFPSRLNTFRTHRRDPISPESSGIGDSDGYM